VEQPTIAAAAEHDATDRVLAATRALVEAVLRIEYHLAVASSVAERFGSRYVEQATRFLQAALEELWVVEEQRRSEVEAASRILGAPAPMTLAELAKAAPEPLRSLLESSRSELISAQRRIKTLQAKAEDVLGRRISLIIEALASPVADSGATYGPQRRPQPRVVSARL